MTTYQTSIVAGVFRDSDNAQKAVEALRGAGFQYDQIGVAMRQAPNATPNLHDDLVRLGVGEDVANFYEREYQAGNIVVSVRPDGRDGEARNILRQFGAYDHSSSLSQSGSEYRPDATHSRNVEGPGSSYTETDQSRRQGSQQSAAEGVRPIAPDDSSEKSDEYGKGWHPGMGKQSGRHEDHRPRP